MSDILLHAAILDNQQVLRTWVLNQISPGAPTGPESYQSNTALLGYPLRNSSNWCSLNIEQCPQIVRQWQKYLKPILKSYSNGFALCSTSNNYTFGTSCTWTVPTGVCCAQFQLWGPGGGSSSQCCCGGAPFGPSGAYMLVQMQVTPGHSYTLCAGCAPCCYATQGGPGIGNPTYITGCGLSVCADAGFSCQLCVWNSDVCSNGSTTQLPTKDSCSAEQCSGWNFCWDSSADDTYVPHAFSSRTWYSLCADTTRNQTYYGLPSVWPAIRIGLSFSCPENISIAAPVFGFEGCACLWNYANCGSLAVSGTGGCNWTANNGYMQHQGAGGYASMTCANCNACGGDSGNGGGICVSWICS
jgi:hypothetical protein